MNNAQLKSPIDKKQLLESLSPMLHTDESQYRLQSSLYATYAAQLVVES